MDAADVHADTFSACTVASIAFRVYVLNEPPSQVEPELVFGGSLRQVEVLVRKQLLQSRNRLCISIEHSGRALWVYKISEPGGNELESLDLSSLDSLLTGTVHNLRTEARGEFLPPFTGPPDRFGPLLRAIELRCLDALLKNGDHEQYEAFGYRAALSVGDGAIVRMKPVLGADGALALRVVCQRAGFIPLPVANINACATLVWLLPHGKSCRVLSSVTVVSAVEPANPARARALFRILSTYFVTNVSLRQLERSMWLRVSSPDAEDMLWPTVLIRATPLTSGTSITSFSGNARAHSAQHPNTVHTPQTLPQGQNSAQVARTNNIAINRSSRPLINLEKPDPYQSLSDVMAAVRLEFHEAEALDARDDLLRHIQNPIPPPSSPRGINPSLSYADIRALAARDQRVLWRQNSESSLMVHASDSEHTPTSFSVGGVPGSHSATPVTPVPLLAAAPGQALHTPSADLVYPTPSYHTPALNSALNTPAAATPSQWPDEEEVGDADFNFFDLPVEDEGEQHQNQQPSIEPEPIPGPPQAKRRAISQWLGRTQFSSLDLPSEIDSKYSSGGRFYVKPDPDDEETASLNRSEAESDLESHSSSSDLESFLESDSDSVPVFAQPQPTQDDAETSWFQSIRYEEPRSVPVNDSKFSSFKQLIPQIVWDGGLLDEISRPSVTLGDIEVAPSYVVERLKVVFNLKQCSITHLVTESERTPQKETQNTSFQLFSPPLVAVQRGDFRIRARISILRFWRLLGLAPSFPRELEPPKTSITVIMVCLDTPALVDGAKRMLSALQTAYSDCNLGKLTLPTFGSVSNGLLPIKALLNHTAGDAVGELYQSACSQLRTQMEAVSGEFQNLIIMVCYPPSSLRGGTLTAIVPFQIAEGVSEIQTLFPRCQWLLASLDLLVSRWDHDKRFRMYDAERLAILLYQRFPHFPKVAQLASLAPKTSGLQYSVEPPQQLMEDEPIMHIAYLVGKGRWCLASWSDQWAKVTKVDIFRLPEDSNKALLAVFKEIWQQGMLVTKKVRDHISWRFCITKLGTMAPFERDLWQEVVLKKSVVILDAPYPSGVKTANSVDWMKIGEKVESADSVVVDENDVVFGASIGIPLPLISGYVNAQAMGFLIRQQRGVVMVFEVRLLVLNEFRIPPRAVMSRVIGQFRRLASLSEYTGVTVKSTLIPWHISALSKLEGASLKLNMF